MKSEVGRYFRLVVRWAFGCGEFGRVHTRM